MKLTDKGASASFSGAVKPSALLSASERRKRKTPKVLCAATSQEQARAVANVGARLRVAREINGWEVSEAARRLGFENAGSLSRLEGARHVSAIPLYLIPRAAQIYGVSTDYLHGLTDDLEVAPSLRLRRDVAVWLADEIERGRRRDIEAMLQLQEQIELVFGCAGDLILAVEELCAAVDYLRGKNEAEFDGLLGGSRVLLRAGESMAKATATASRIVRFKGMLKSRGVKVHEPLDVQMTLELVG